MPTNKAAERRLVQRDPNDLRIKALDEVYSAARASRPVCATVYALIKQLRGEKPDEVSRG